MDFRQTFQPGSGRPAATPVAPTPPEHKEEKPEKPASRKDKSGVPGKFMRIIYAILLVGIAVLLICIAFGITRNTNPKESQYIDSSKYQAVFLSNGQVYFGHINDLNSEFVHMSNIYYLTQADSTASSNYSLVKLGCQQIHDPIDEMIINRSQVTFWENLNDDGKVAKSIEQFKQQNPNGPDCSQVSSSTQASGSSTQSSQNSTSTGTNGSNSSTK